MARVPSRPELLADRREDVVGLNRRNVPGTSLGESGSKHAATGERIIGLDRLVAGNERILPRVEPVLDPDPDAAKTRGRRLHRRPAKATEPDSDVDRPATGEVEHGEEDGKEHQGRTKVVEHDQGEQRGQPHQAHRHQVRNGRQFDAPTRQEKPSRSR